MSIRTLHVRKALAGMSLLRIGVLAGGIMGAVGIANAADAPAPTATASADSSAPRSGETALTGDDLAKVKAAVLAAYPGATFDRVETDSDGVYEAHIVTSAGEELTVQIDEAFAITGTE